MTYAHRLCNVSPNPRELALGELTELMNAHTPGPWTFEAGNEFQFTGSNGQPVLLISDTRRLIPMGPDALLIAAAPELLAALKEVRAYLDATGQLIFNPTGGMMGRAVAHLEDAIAKAEGNS